ncbi:MAG: ATP-binding protein [Muribaculaceae bacterium]|nr:ATP-binding protein [Muribaculaceae bacterium]
MKSIYATSHRLVKAVDTSIHRYLYDRIPWDDRLIMIKGARGAGKTTMLLQRIKENFGHSEAALYASCDDLWFTDNRIIDLADYHYKHGGTHLFLDEIHLYEGNWQRELKNIYDSYPVYHVIFTGSSIIHLDMALADLSRRCLPYRLYGLSFREFLKFKGIADIPPITLEEMLDLSHSKEHEILELLPGRLLALFEQYLGKGYYPFFLQGALPEYYGRITRAAEVSIMRDIPAVEKIEYETLYKIRKLLYVLSSEVPFTLNVQSLSQKIQVSRNTIIKMFELLGKGAILRTLHNGWRSPKSVAKPDKVLFDNTDIMAALSSMNDIGTVRETFVSSMLAPFHELQDPTAGDLLVDGKYLFEIGGKTKTFKQIADIDNSYVIADEEETCIGNRLPMWLLGFLY